MDSQRFDRDYLERLRGSDPATERHFTRHFRELIRLKLRGKIRSPQLVEDISQETFLRVLVALRKEHGLNDPERLPGFIHAVCKNVTLELLRFDTRHPLIPENAPEPPAPLADPDEPIVNEERKVLVREVLDQMSDRDRAILRLIFLEEIDKQEVCRRFQVDSGYLRVLLHRAKQRFRRALDSQGSRHRAAR